MKLNQFIPQVGMFYTGFYYEYDEKRVNGTYYKDPILIRYKQNDEGTQGVSSGGKAEHMVQDSQGRPIGKRVFTIKVTDNLPYKVRDNFKIQDGQTYTVVSYFIDETTTNSINNLQFSHMRDNKQFVLVLGEK